MKKSRASDKVFREFMTKVVDRNPGEPEFHQAVHEVMESIIPFIHDNSKYQAPWLLDHLTEPDRIIVFRICWHDDNDRIHVNRGWRIQFNNAIGPYKGGLRFHPTVNVSVLKFLGFEQIFKNSLTGLPMGGAKGGSDFNPRGRSDHEVMRFCQAMMTELSRHIGENMDVPAGDIGVGAREIGYLYGQWKRLQNRHAGVITGKGLPYGGSLIRTEATGYGAVYFMENMLARWSEGLEDKTAVVSGSGNVSLYCVEKLIKRRCRVLTLSDSDGFIHDPDGIDEEKLAWVKDLKEVRRGRMSEYAKRFPRATFHEGKTPWAVPAQLAFPCATQNEILAEDAQAMAVGGCMAVSEGANMPSTPEAIDIFAKNRILFGPGKAANAGGVAVSGLEQSQNSMRLSWTREECQRRLKEIMRNIHEKCVLYGDDGKGRIDYVRGANIGGFVKVADAMLAYGVI